jgi:hypothetical protein
MPKPDPEKLQRERKYSPDEMPPDPTPGDPGKDMRDQQWLERQRAAERERSKKPQKVFRPRGSPARGPCACSR